MGQKDVEKIRTAIADYMKSEGCSCCQDAAAHEANTKRLANLLGVPLYKDGSGYNFTPFRTTKD
jgi:methionine aminopeptidase